LPPLYIYRGVAGPTGLGGGAWKPYEPSRAAGSIGAHEMFFAGVWLAFRVDESFPRLFRH
jgi:hypothetical protein